MLVVLFSWWVLIVVLLFVLICFVDCGSAVCFNLFC